MALALFFSNSVGLLFRILPKAVLGVILFFAGAELAITTVWINKPGTRTDEPDVLDIE